MNPFAWIDTSLAELKISDLLRELPAGLEAAGPLTTGPLSAGCVNFASNDYLGMAGDARLGSAAVAACQQQGVGRAASPLICGRSTLHEQLEARLAEFLNAEAALLFTSGYAANVGVVPALVDRGDCVYGDSLNHASLIDGCRLSRAERHVYSHCDMSELETLLAAGGGFRRRLIVSDTLFSMDGDLAPLIELVRLARKYDAMLLIDEAHALGVFGNRVGKGGGGGLWEHIADEIPDAESAPVVRMGTLSKALGSAGGLVCGSKSLVKWLANRSRSFVFSTAHPSANSAAALAALDIIEANPHCGALLLQKASDLRERLTAQGWDVTPSASQIIPIRIGSAKQALALAGRLREAGYWVPAIRPPSVPEGQSLLRLSLTTAHTEAMVDGLMEELGKA
ncbi:aminotransferase class I/II-fold pyridoxal phosphate-dependent enzyme [Adhaeretor mobilis]|uniref:8-amino-7-oxononanoate synthase n=1 Tax=Adhaeretor mobilis TaxID=1930276 RepID=A0A517N2U5_9BACT|nr:8-amino-7-oxononanoate synthase [Adhaeretor mobilis]QDT01328.1 8-amino-7-oxononanoate synthase 2 [Adhaeretor mobilis]